jgi:hypothetical protein
VKNNLGKISASTALSTLIVLGLVSHIDTADAKAQKKGSFREFNENNPGILPAGAILVVGGLLIGGGYAAYSYKMKSDEKADQKQPLAQTSDIPENIPNSNTPNSSVGNNFPEASEPTESPQETELDETIDETIDETTTTPTASSESDTAENTPASSTEDAGTKNAEDKSTFSRVFGKLKGKIKGKYERYKQDNSAKKHWLEAKRIELAADKDRQDQKANELRVKQKNVDRSITKVTNDLGDVMSRESALDFKSVLIDNYEQEVNDKKSKVDRGQYNQYHKSIRERQADVNRMNDLEAKSHLEGGISSEDHESLKKLQRLEALRKQRDEQEAMLNSNYAL